MWLCVRVDSISYRIISNLCSSAVRMDAVLALLRAPLPQGTADAREQRRRWPVGDEDDAAGGRSKKRDEAGERGDEGRWNADQPEWGQQQRYSQTAAVMETTAASLAHSFPKFRGHIVAHSVPTRATKSCPWWFRGREEGAWIRSVGYRRGDCRASRGR